MAALATPSRRYVIRQILGQGGMGIVYRAYDNETRREVTLKTLLDVSSPEMLDLFRKECEILSRLNHPNIVDIYDVGEIEIDGALKPYFVMPLLPGKTLDLLISDASYRLTVDRVVEIIAQACRGLQAAHERGLIHRDVKPTNLFVLGDDSVKVIDFGVAHLAGGRTNTLVKGTLHYMSPEQVQAKKLSPASDIYSLGVVCYEALTRRRPFEGSTVEEIVDAIQHQTPPLLSELNPSVGRILSQVVHKAMAKQAFYRFPSARDFADTLQKAARNERLEIFDETRMLSRIERARKSLETGEFEFASEVLSGLENEGYAAPEMPILRRQVDQANRERTIGQLLESARRCFREDEYEIALRKIDDVLRLDPHNAAAVTLRSEIDNQRSSDQVKRWMALANEHLKNHAYEHARQALDDVLQLRPDHPEARKLLALVESRRQEYVRLRKERDELYEAALAAQLRGEVSTALSGMRRVMELIKLAPDTTDPGRATAYEHSYNQIRSDYDQLKSAYDQARRHLNEHNFKAALAICEEYLAKYPGNALFQSLKVDVEETRRQDLSAFVARIDREVENEPDLERRISILRDALSTCPGEPHFERALELTRTKRELVASIVSKGRAYEEKRQFTEALGQWEMMRTIYPRYPGLDFEIERCEKRRENQVREEAKARWVHDIDQALSQSEWDGAVELVRDALAEFPADGELKALEQIAGQRKSRCSEARALLDRSKAILSAGDVEEGIATLRRALELDGQEPGVRAALTDALLVQAKALHTSQPDAAADLVRQALELDPSNPLAKSLNTLLEDQRRQEFVDACLAEARQHQAAGHLEEALARVESGLSEWPREPRLLQLKESLERAQTTQQRQLERRRDLDSVLELEASAKQAADAREVRDLLHKTQTIASRYEGDRDFESIVEFLRAQLSSQDSSEAAPEAAVNVEPESPPRPEIVSKPPAPARHVALLTPERRRRLILAAAGLFILVAVVFGVVRFVSRSQSGSAAVPVRLATEPAGAEIGIDGQSRGASPVQVSLPAGRHRVTVSMPGYETVSQEWDVGRGFNGNQLVRLTASPAHLHVVSEVPDVQATIDGSQATPLAAGVPLHLQDLAFGAEHSVALGSGSGRASFTFRLTPGKIPEVAVAPSPSGVPAFLLATSGSAGRFYATRNVRVSLGEERPSSDAGPQGVSLEGLPESGSLVIAENNDTTWLLDFKTESGPAVFAMVGSTSVAPFGTLVIQSVESDFTILVDGRPTQARRKGSQFVARIPAGRHTIEFQKAGYTVEPKTVEREIKPGAKIVTALQWTGVPARVTIRGAVPGTQVYIDERLAYTVGASGVQQLSISKGHQLRLSAPRYETKRIQREFQPDMDIEIGPPESVLEPVSGYINLALKEPATGVVVEVIGQTRGIRYAGPNPLRNTVRIKLPLGSYSLRLSAPRHASEEISVDVTDSPLSVPVDLARQ